MIEAMTQAGFYYRETTGLNMFVEDPDGSARDAVHVIFANEKGRPKEAAPAPDVSESEPGRTFHVLAFEALVRMELISDRRINRVNLRDMIDVGLLDATWKARFTPELAERLQFLLDTPDG